MDHELPNDRTTEPSGESYAPEWEHQDHDAITADGDTEDIPDDLEPGDAEATEVPTTTDQSLGALATGKELNVDGVRDLEDIPHISDEEARRSQRELRQKAYFVKTVMDGSTPASEQGQRVTERVVAISKNTSELRDPESELRRSVEEYLTSREPVDPFAIQEQSAKIVGAALRGVEDMDNVDLILASRATDSALGLVVEDMSGTINSDRLAELYQALNMDFVQAVAPHKIVGGAIAPVKELYSRMFGEEVSEAIDSRLTRLQICIKDRLIVSDMIVGAGLWDAPGAPTRGPYGRPPEQGELARLNARAADTIERLHLLKAYGVAPFEVSGDLLDLPWDIAVIPPLDIHRPGETPKYADGAIADFMFLATGEEREDLLMHYDEKTDEDGIRTTVSLGNAASWMRFRLHDNGQISYGLQFHNIPSDNAEKVFSENEAGAAFQRLRGLFIALAFDALVPDDVVRGRDVRGSVASSLGERPEQPIGRRITEIVLRRQRALQRANVDRTHRQPTGWEGPTQRIEGYMRRLPEGCRPRPTAEQEAREYYETRGIRFNGLPEGYNWVGEYDRRTTTEIIYRRARFRRDTATREHLRDVQGRRGRRGRRN